MDPIITAQYGFFLAVEQFNRTSQAARSAAAPDIATLPLTDGAGPSPLGRAIAAKRVADHHAQAQAQVGRLAAEMMTDLLRLQAGSGEL